MTVFELRRLRIKFTDSLSVQLEVHVTIYSVFAFQVVTVCESLPHFKFNLKL